MKKNRFPGLLIFILIIVELLLPGCDNGRPDNKQQASDVIHLKRLAPLEQANTDERKQNFKVAVAAILSPRGTAASYQPFLNYLAQRLDMPVQLVQRRTYQEINDIVARNAVDMAFVCTGAFLDGLRKNQMKLLAIPQIQGKRTYNALIIVPATATTSTFEELRNHIFAFTDPLSNTGYLYPLSLLNKRGWKKNIFFFQTLFTYSHDHSIAAVAEGIADGASVDSLVYSYAVKRDPSLAKRTRIILRSPDFGMPPIVVSTKARESEIEKLRHILLSMGDHEDSSTILKQLGIDRFVQPDYSLYPISKSIPADQ